MAGEGSPNYLRAAFANVYNLSMLGGAFAISAATGDWFVGAAAVGLEALWLLLGPDLKPFQRMIRRQAAEEAEKKDRERVNKLMETLPERDWQRAKALDELRREIERDMQNNPTFQAILLAPELEKLSQLHMAFVTLASACNRAETYLGATNLRDLERQIEVHQRLTQNVKDPGAADIAQKNVDVLKKRIETIGEIQGFLGRARGQMNLIENTVRLLRDQVLTMASPEALGEQLSDLLTGVEAVQASARENEVLLQGVGGMEPIAPIATADSVAPNLTDTTRQRQ
jgi:hypothetical protein